MVSQIVGRCHVAESNRKVLRYFISRLKDGYQTWRALTRKQRRYWMRQVFAEHKANRDLYRDVWGGWF